jgi:L-rhamnose mutarotase
MSGKRVGRVIKLRSEKAEEYRKLHADDNPGVRDLLKKYNIQDFSIFTRKLDDGHEYLFAYFKYTGEDFDRDFEGLKSEPRNQEWKALCDPCQEPLEGEEAWSLMEEIYYNE